MNAAYSLKLAFDVPQHIHAFQKRYILVLGLVFSEKEFLFDTRVMVGLYECQPAECLSEAIFIVIFTRNIQCLRYSL